MSSAYERARESGYSEEEITRYLSQKDKNFSKKYEQAIKSGYQPEEVLRFASEQEKKPKESLLSNIGRQAGRSTARVVETVAGAPRALGDFLESLVPEKIIKKGAEKIGLKEPVEKGMEFAKEYAPYKLFPSSQDIRKNVTKGLFGEKLEPKNEWEAKADEVVSDFAALALPFPGAQFKVIKPALLSLGGNVASEIVGKMGGSEKEKTYAKLGTILAGSMINPKAAENLKNDLYKDARAARPADAKVNAGNLSTKSSALEKELMKGDPKAASKTKAVGLLKDLRSKIENKEISVDELEQFKRDINEARSSLYETFKTDKVGRKSAKRNLDSVSKLVDSTLSEYGKQNPQWEAFYRPANEVHGAIAQSKKARDVISRVAKKYGHHAILPILGLGHYGGATAIEGVLGSAAIGAAGLGASEIGSRIWKSPTLRKHYTNLVNSALADDVVLIEENLKKLEKALKEEESTQSNPRA